MVGTHGIAVLVDTFCLNLTAILFVVNVIRHPTAWCFNIKPLCDLSNLHFRALYY